MKRLRLIAILAIVLLAGLLALYLHHNREPTYQGRTLTEWLKDCDTSSGPLHVSFEQFSAATNAVKQIGTNGIPFLLKKITSKEIPLERKLKSLLNKQSLIHFHLADPGQGQHLALAGFEILGKDATSAVPALAALTNDSDSEVRRFALFALYGIGPDKEILMPILLHSLKHPHPKTRLVAADVLVRFNREEAEKAGIYKEFPWLKSTNATAAQ